MNALTFDTHVFVKRLTAAGMPEAQAEVLAEEQTNLIENNLATKRDLKELEVTLKGHVETQNKELEVRLVSQIKELEVTLKGDIAKFASQIRDSEVRTIKWLVPLFLGQAALVAALVKLL